MKINTTNATTPADNMSDEDFLALLRQHNDGELFIRMGLARRGLHVDENASIQQVTKWITNTTPKMLLKSGGKVVKKSSKTKTLKAKKTPALPAPPPAQPAQQESLAHPPWNEALAIVMGTKSMTIDKVKAGLKARGWFPYDVGSMLSTGAKEGKFVRVDRGVYKVDPAFRKMLEANSTPQGK